MPTRNDQQGPEELKGQTIVLTANSTGDYAVQPCQKKYGLAKADVTIKNMGQAEIISALSSNNADGGRVGRPTSTRSKKKPARSCCAAARTAASSCPVR